MAPPRRLRSQALNKLALLSAATDSGPDLARLCESCPISQDAFPRQIATGTVPMVKFSHAWGKLVLTIAEH